jgi:hypothetical protein
MQHIAEETNTYIYRSLLGDVVGSKLQCGVRVPIPDELDQILLFQTIEQGWIAFQQLERDGRKM